MDLNLTFTNCTPADAARLIQAAGPLGSVSVSPAPGGQPQPSYAPPAGAPGGQPPGMPPMGGPPPGMPPMQPPAQQPPPPPPVQQPPQQGGLTPEHLYDAMSKYAATYKPDGIKAVMAQYGLASGLLPQADQNQLAWIKRHFETMTAPGAQIVG